MKEREFKKLIPCPQCNSEDNVWKIIVLGNISPVVILPNNAPKEYKKELWYFQEWFNNAKQITVSCNSCKYYDVVER